MPTAHGEEFKQSEGNTTVNATDSSDDAANSTSNLVSCTTGKESGGQPVEVYIVYIKVKPSWYMSSSFPTRVLSLSLNVAREVKCV